MFTRIFLLVIMGFLGLSFADRVFYQPSRLKPVPPSSQEYVVQETRIPCDNGWLSAWVAEPTPEQARGTILFSHGNAGNLENHFPFIDFLPLHGYRVILFDYRGYGASSPMSPSRASTMEDVLTALQYAHNQYGKVYLMGHSLGASLAICVAPKRRDSIRGVIAIAAFTSYRGIARAVLGHPGILTPIAWPLGFLVSKGDDPIECVDQRAPLPLLLIHTRNDEIIPSRMSQILYDRASSPKKLVLLPSGSHNSDWKEMGQEYLRSVLEFLAKTTPTSAESE